MFGESQRGGDVPTVDVHGHALVPAADRLVEGLPGALAAAATERETFGAAAMEVNAAQLARVVPLLTDLDARLEAMERARVDVQLVSPVGVHHHEWAEPALARRIAAVVNERIAELCAQAPERIVGLGQISIQHPELAVAELDEVVGEFGLRGVVIKTAAGPRKLSDPALEGVWARAAELGAIVFVHPLGTTLGARLDEDYLANTVGQPVETTVALSQLLFAGVLDRHPGLRLLAAHGGGYLPFFMARADHAWEVRPDVDRAARRPSEYLSQIYFDTVVFSPDALERLVEAVGVERVMLGSDIPFDMGVEDPLGVLERTERLDDEAREAIRGRTAADLLGLVGASAASTTSATTGDT